MRRSLVDKLFWAGCILAFAIIVVPSLSILVSVFHGAAPVLGWSLLSKTTLDPRGLQNAILGTLVLLLGVLIVAGTIGVAAGIYLAEFAPPRLGSVLRFLSEILSGMPSIVIGYVGYTALVVGFHWKYSLLAAIFALSTLVLPYIVKTTEVAMRQVPSTLREGAHGLGVTSNDTVWRILVPPAIPGIVSGLIVALAISTGETAPLLYTAGFSNANPGLHLFNHGVPYLTYVTYSDVSQPGALPHEMADAAAAVTMILLILLIALGRLVASRSRRSTERMAL
jgi:phosphate transport system permease protein